MTGPKARSRPPQPGSASLALAIAVAGCSGGPRGTAEPIYRGGAAPASIAADRAMIHIPAGSYIAGSGSAERNTAYADYERTAGHDGAREHNWFEREQPRHEANLIPYWIDRTPVTNAAYAEFVADTGEPAPAIDAATWDRQGFNQDYATEVVRFAWRHGRPPAQRADHPVVLVTWKQAARYCAWRGQLVGQARQLPTAAQFEKAARGPGGSIYPWGAELDPSKLNSAVEGPRDTTPVGRFAGGASHYGALDVAGNVFQWTSTPWSKDRMTVKGSAWDDYGGLGRGAAQHGRRIWVKHAIVGFRCAG